MGFYYYNAVGECLFASEPPLEPPDVFEGDEEDEEDDTPDWVYDEDHSYVLRGGQVIRYE